eukprot:341165_1
MYAQILEKLMGISVLSTAVSHSKLSFFTYPQLQESSIISIRLFRELIKFMQKVGVPDFSISDLISPESGRTIRNLSAIINFARWREHKYQLFSEQKLTLDESNKTLLSKKAENTKLAEEFVRLREKKELEKPQIDALNKETEQLLKTMEHANREVENKGTIGHQLKKEYKQLKQSDSEKKAFLNKNTETIRNLEKKIVKSPERIKKELKMLSNTIQKEKVDINTMTQSVKYMANKENQLKLLNVTINKRNGEMQRIHLMKNDQFKALKQERENAQNIKKGKEKELKSITKQHKLMNINLSTKKTDLSELKEQHKARKTAISTKNEQINHLKQQHSKKRIAKQTEISHLDKKIEAKKESIQNLEKENNDYMTEINTKYKQVAHAVHVYNDNMR